MADQSDAGLFQNEKQGCLHYNIWGVLKTSHEDEHIVDTGTRRRCHRFPMFDWCQVEWPWIVGRFLGSQPNDNNDSGRVLKGDSSPPGGKLTSLLTTVWVVRMVTIG